jgi:hypothetical protein
MHLLIPSSASRDAAHVLVGTSSSSRGAPQPPTSCETPELPALLLPELLTAPGNERKSGFHYSEALRRVEVVAGGMKSSLQFKPSLFEWFSPAVGGAYQRLDPMTPLDWRISVERRPVSPNEVVVIEDLGDLTTAFLEHGSHGNPPGRWGYRERARRAV